jgi:iron complex outermembrane receptor protein
MNKIWPGSKFTKIALCAAALALSTATNAQQLNVKIPPGDLKAAIDAYVATTGVQLVYRSADVKGQVTKGVEGSMTSTEALAKLLEGTQLKMRRDSSGAVVIFHSEAQSGAASSPGTDASPAESLNPETGMASVVIYGKASHLASQNRTGTRMDADAMTVPLSVTTVEKGLLEQQQSLNLRDAVANVAGVTEINGTGTYTMRGFGAGLMRNGNLVASPTGIDVPLMAVSRLEVVKGPEAIIAGVTAGYGGVINIISKAPQVAPISELALTVGSRRYYEAGVDLGRPLNASKTLLGRVVVSKQGASINQYGYDGPTSDYVAPSLTWRNKPTRTEITAQYEYQNKRTPALATVLTDQSSLDGRLKPVFVGSASDGVDSKSKVATLTINQYLGDGWELSLNYVDERRFNNGTAGSVFPSSLLGFPAGDIVYFGGTTDSTYNSKSTKLELKGELETGPLKHKLIFAYDRARRHVEAGSASVSLTSTDPETGVVTDLVPVLGSAFGIPSPRLGGGQDPVESAVLVMDQVQWGKWIALGGWRSIKYVPARRGVSLPDFNRSLPSLGLLYRATPTLSFYGNVSKGFLPNSGNLGFGGSSIPPEDAQQSELGVKWQLPERKAAFTAAVFDIQQKNVAVPDAAHPGLQCGGQVCYLSVEGVRSKGIELEFSGQIARGVEVRANYTYLDKASDTPNLIGAAYAKNTLNLWGSYRFSGDPALGWWVGGGLQARSARNAAANSAANPGNGRVDISTGFDAKRWSVVAGVKNVADKRLYTLQSGLFNLGVAYQPREVFLTARYNFN